jgi:hypothetical protein
MAEPTGMYELVSRMMRIRSGLDAPAGDTDFGTLGTDMIETGIAMRLAVEDPGDIAERLYQLADALVKIERGTQR